MPGPTTPITDREKAAIAALKLGLLPDSRSAYIAAEDKPAKTVNPVGIKTLVSRWINSDKVKQYGKAIYLPLSVDVEYVTRFRAARKTKDTCFVGRPVKRTKQLPAGIDYLQSMPRELLLTELAQYEKAYAVDRCAIEAKILDCEVLDYGYNYGVPHSPDFWEIIDNSEAAEMLNVMVRNIDG